MQYNLANIPVGCAAIDYYIYFFYNCHKTSDAKTKKTHCLRMRANVAALNSSKTVQEQRRRGYSKKKKIPKLDNLMTEHGGILSFSWKMEIFFVEEGSFIN